MSFVDWSSQYSVNDAEMDAHHQALFTIVNDLHQAIFSRKDKDELGKIITRLMEHTQTHFAAEERLMQARHYPHFALHKAEHDRMLKQVGELERNFRASPSNGIADMLAILVKDWLVGHVLKYDKDYSFKQSILVAEQFNRQPHAPI